VSEAPSGGSSRRCDARVAAEDTAESGARYRQVRRGHVLFRAPSPPTTYGLIIVASAALAALLFYPSVTHFLEGFLLVGILPPIIASALTTPLCAALGGKFEFHRSVFLALTVLLVLIPLAALWRLAYWVDPSVIPDMTYLGIFLAGPAFWFRHASLYGVSRPSHGLMLLPSLLQPVIYLAGFFVIVPPTTLLVGEAAAFLALAFVLAVALIRASDRPIRREFGISGVSLIRPLLDHVGRRDPEATRALEAFFLRGAIPGNITARVIAFSRGGSVKATIALPTVHPGPFAALGASDLPHKLSEKLTASAGTVFVPHTPCDHDLDLPSDEEVDRVAAATRDLLGSLPASGVARGSPLVSPYPGSLARAQLLGDVVLVLVTQAPKPTDDIAFSVADRIVREVAQEGGPRVALVDAHNSYIEGQGDILYGTPTAERLVTDTKAAVKAALAAARDGPIEVGVAVRKGYSIGRDGIGPEGLRALVVRAGGKTTGYVLIDGNNLVIGDRDPIVRSLLERVDVAEVLTTDNHVVHEVDGGINPLGERYPLEAMTRDARAVLEKAFQDLEAVSANFAETKVTGVKILGPGYTARLLTSLGDTLSMFMYMFASTLLLLVTSSLVILLALR
jgi:putative membrane protein